MVQHIDISALLAEIEREYKSLFNAANGFAMGREVELKNILHRTHISTVTRHSEHEKEIYQTNKNNHIQWPHIASATANWQPAVVQWVFLHSQ